MRTEVFELHVQFKVMKLQFEEITKSFTFKYFQKTEVHLEPIQTSQMNFL